MSDHVQLNVEERRDQTKEAGKRLFDKLPWDFVSTHQGAWVIFHVESGMWIWAWEWSIAVDYFTELHGNTTPGYVCQVQVYH